MAGSESESENEQPILLKASVKMNTKKAIESVTELTSLSTGYRIKNSTRQITQSDEKTSMIRPDCIRKQSRWACKVTLLKDEPTQDTGDVLREIHFHQTKYKLLERRENSLKVDVLTMH